jgi:hypothetical protein
MNFRKKFVVKPGAKFRLCDIDPTYKGEHESHQSGAAELARHTASLAQLQYKLYAENKRSLLIILQGFDAAGKDGVIHHVISGTNPQGVNVACFRQPTHEELAHDFLWRAHRHTPANGEIMIFNRSHYEDVLVVRVHGIVPKSVWSKRYDRIREFEKLLIQADTHIVKFPSNHKWFRDLAISSILVDTLDEMDIKIPQPVADLKAIRRQYHSAEIEQTKDEQLGLLPGGPKKHNKKSDAGIAKGRSPKA